MTVVFLHPLPLDGSIWSPELMELGESSLTPTLYGYGSRLESWAEGVIDTCGAGPLVLVGNSVGGSCALEIVRLVPERVSLIVLIGTKAGHRPDPELRDQALRVLENEGLDAAWRRYWEPLFAPDADPEVVECARLTAQRQGPEAIATGVRVFHSRADRSRFAKSLTIPVAVVAGQHDIARRQAERFAADLRAGTFRCLHGAGHYVPLERPTELAGVVREVVMEMEDATPRTS